MFGEKRFRVEVGVGDEPRSLKSDWVITENGFIEQAILEAHLFGMEVDMSTGRLVQSVELQIGEWEVDIADENFAGFLAEEKGGGTVVLTIEGGQWQACGERAPHLYFDDASSEFLLVSEGKVRLSGPNMLIKLLNQAVFLFF